MRALWPFTARGTVLIFVGAVAVGIGAALHASTFVFTGIAVVGVVLCCLFSLWLRPVVRESVRTATPAVVSVGDDVSVRLSIHVGRDRAARFRWDDRVRREHARRHGDLIPDAEGIARAAYVCTPRRRGEQTFGPLQVTATDALGLAMRRQTHRPATTLVVGPEVIALDELGLAPAVGAGGRTVAAYAGEGDDDLVPRPYQRGDSRRRVHWKATAHRGELMVRQEEHEAAPVATVVLARDAPDDHAFELLLSAAASVAVHLAESGRSVDVVDVDGATYARRLGADTTDLLSGLAYAQRGRADSPTPQLTRPVVGPVVLVAAEASRATPVAAGSTLIATLTTADVAPAPGVGRLRQGIAEAWREALLGDDS